MRRSLKVTRFVSIISVLLMLGFVSPAQSWAGGAGARSATAHHHLSIAGPQSLPAQSTLPFQPGQLIVKLLGDDAISSVGGSLTSASPQLAQLLSCFDLRHASSVLPGVYSLSVPASSGLDVEAAARALEESGTVAYAEPNYTVHAMVNPNDEQYVAGQQWGLTQIK
ncbi:MAG TPA: hypothetical protein VM409_05840, partial [Chloroflexia bacterium]|nr:hypothetical protein [Chloroflexia bacterium]